jgi:energy-coupling factor transporter ATP-binding protein EcfA2
MGPAPLLSLRAITKRFPGVTANDRVDLVLDGPTRSLAPHEVDGLFASFAQLRRDGYAVVFIAHKLREVLACADRITVMRRGADEGALPAHQGRLPQLPAFGGQQGLRVRGVAGQGRGDRGHAGDPQALRAEVSDGGAGPPRARPARQTGAF